MGDEHCCYEGSHVWSSTEELYANVGRGIAGALSVAVDCVPLVSGVILWESGMYCICMALQELEVLRFEDWTRGLQ